MKHIRIALLIALVTVSLASCSGPQDQSSATVTKIVTASQTWHSSNRTPAPETSTVTKAKPAVRKVLHFYSPSGSIFCAGDTTNAGCSLVSAKWPANTENALSCDSYMFPIASAIGFMNGKSACWYTARVGNFPNVPTLGYGESAKLESPRGLLTCDMSMDGVTCVTESGKDGFFASKQEFRYLTEGRWYPRS